MTLSANGFVVHDTSGGAAGSIVVNGREIDFFSATACGLSLPSGVGRYQWSLLGTNLHFAPLNTDPCPVRSGHFANHTFTRGTA